MVMPASRAGEPIASEPAASRPTGPRCARHLEGSVPTFAGGQRSWPPVQRSGRGPGDVKSLAKTIVEAERDSGSAEAP